MTRELMIHRETVDGLNRLTWESSELVGLTDDEVDTVIPTIQNRSFKPDDWPGQYQNFEFSER